MADNTDWFADVEAALADTTDTPAEAEESTSLESGNAPGTDGQAAADDASSEHVNAQALTEVDAAVAAGEAAAAMTAASAPAPDWNTPENPHYVRSQQLDSMQAQAKAIVDQAAYQRAQELYDQRMKQYSDDDPERERELRQFVTQAQQPIVNHAQRLESEVEFAAKLATVIDESVKHVVPQEYQAKVYQEVERMMALPGGPDYLQRDLAARSSERTQYETALQAERAKNAELIKRMEARGILDERAETGADRVESGSGNTLGFQARWDAASNFDEAFDAIVSTFPH